MKMGVLDIDAWLVVRGTWRCKRKLREGGGEGGLEREIQ